MKEIKIVVDGKEVVLKREQIDGSNFSLTEEQIDYLDINKNVFERKHRGTYSYINSYSTVSNTVDEHTSFDNLLYDSANYCTDEIIMKKRAVDEVLNRLLWRFSMENCWDDSLFYDDEKFKYYIYYDYTYNKYKVEYCRCTRGIGGVYYISRDIAAMAINTIIKPFERGELPICKRFNE